MSGPEPRPMVLLRGVSKRFGSEPAVKEVTLAVARGEFVTLLGPSGCGKTTTLMLIAGFVRPNSGEIRLDDADVTHAPPYKRDVGVVFQNYALFPHLSVFENIAFPLRLRRQSAEQIKANVEAALRAVHMEKFAERMPRQLSGGQQQRVALARVLVYRPGVLLMDEPLAALDRKLREAMQLEIKQIHRQFGITTLYVTHDQQEALTLSDRIVVMNGGAIEQVGSPQELYEAPRTEFVAKFVGESNVFEAEIVARDASMARLRTRFGTEIRLSSPQGLPESGRVKLAVRPEKIALTPTSPRREHAILGTVRDVIYNGELTRFQVELSTGDAFSVSRQNSGQRLRLDPGAAVQLSWADADTIVLAR